MNQVDNIKEEAMGAAASMAGGTEAGIRNKISQMAESAKNMTAQDMLKKFAGFQESGILSFVPDKRSWSGITTIILGILFLILLPGKFKILSVIFFIGGISTFFIRYYNNSKIDVPDGYVGVPCKNGMPLNETAAAEAGKSVEQGRNWIFHPFFFIPYIVSSRDQIFDTKNQTFTCDFYRIGMKFQIVYQVSDSVNFVKNTTPALIMKILDLYANYVALRMISSIQDSRVKFTNTQDLPNVVAALNSYLEKYAYGITVRRVNIPEVENGVIDELETIRTMLKSIEMMDENFQFRLESAIKKVESEMRQARKDVRKASLDLQQQSIKLETKVTEEINKEKQQKLIDSRRLLDQLTTQLKKSMASVQAKINKSQTIKESIKAIKADLNLRIANVKRTAFLRRIPKKVHILNVDGIGHGVGMSMGNQLIKGLLPETQETQKSQE